MVLVAAASDQRRWRQEASSAQQRTATDRPTACSFSSCSACRPYDDDDDDDGDDGPWRADIIVVCCWLMATASLSLAEAAGQSS